MPAFGPRAARNRLTSSSRSLACTRTRFVSTRCVRRTVSAPTALASWRLSPRLLRRFRFGPPLALSWNRSTAARTSARRSSPGADGLRPPCRASGTSSAPPAVHVEEHPPQQGASGPPRPGVLDDHVEPTVGRQPDMQVRLGDGRVVAGHAGPRKALGDGPAEGIVGRPEQHGHPGSRTLDQLRLEVLEKGAVEPFRHAGLPGDLGQGAARRRLHRSGYLGAPSHEPHAHEP